MNRSLAIGLLGSFSLRQGAQPITTLNAERPQSLLAYLLLHRQTPISRQQLAYTFWPDSAEEQARTNLRNLLYTLRRHLPDADHFVWFDTHTVQWRADANFTLDVADFEQALAAGRQAANPQARLAAWGTAVTLYKGPLLPGIYDDWLIPLRERLHDAYLEALRTCAQLAAELGDLPTAVQYARTLQREDPLAETAVILLMQVYGQLGDQTAVHRAYQAGVAALRQELDAEPGLETQAAYAAALQQAARGLTPDAAAPETAVPLRASPRQAPQLPPQPTPFVGREAELAKLAEWLADRSCRLITITGPGGAGKTRLAMQAAMGHATVFADGVAFVPLTAVTDPTLLPSAIAQGLDFTFTGAAPRQTQLQQYLADKTLLLLLDNAEQLGERVAFLAELLAAAPRVKLLVTSRHRLRLQEEWVFPLQGLPLPDTADVQTIAANSAATLFVQAAQRHNPGFAPNAADWQAISRICQLVDGMPLGLELAAPWIRLLSCAEIGAEIAKNLDFLTSAHQNMPERHRSLRAVFNQTWQMLTPAEQAAFGSLSLFVGGFSREAAEQVAGADLHTLSALLDKSLVRRLRNGRYDIHELLRQYAAGQLTPEANQAAAARLAAYYLALVETAASHLIGPEQQTWLAALELEYDNIQVALGWGIASGDGDTAVRLGAGLGRYWWLRYRPVEGGAWLRQILAMPGLPAAATSRALTYAGMLARLRRDYAEAENWLTESAHNLRQTGNKQDLGRTLNELGMLYLDQGHADQAQPLFAECLALAQELDSPHISSIALLNLGMATQYLGHLDEAERYYQEGLVLSRQLNLQTNLAMILNSYSALLLDQNRLETAREMLLESVQLNVTLGHQDGIAWAFLGLLTLHHLKDEFETAACLVGVQETLRRQLGAPLPPTNQRHFDNISHELRQQLGAESFAAYREQGQRLTVVNALSLVQNL